MAQAHWFLKQTPPCLFQDKAFAKDMLDRFLLPAFTERMVSSFDHVLVMAQLFTMSCCFCLENHAHVGIWATDWSLSIEWVRGFTKYLS